MLRLNPGYPLSANCQYSRRKKSRMTKHFSVSVFFMGLICSFSKFETNTKIISIDYISTSCIYLISPFFKFSKLQNIFNITNHLANLFLYNFTNCYSGAFPCIKKTPEAISGFLWKGHLCINEQICS